MGTYYTNGASKQDIIRELTEDGAYTKHVVVEKSLVGNNLWVVIGSREDSTKDRALLLYLLRYDRDGWGYKPMDESVGPCESNCPLKYLEMVTCPGGYAIEFRKRVREFHKRQSDKRKQRKQIAFIASLRYDIEQLKSTEEPV